MYKRDILQSLKNYYEENPKFKFYGECINKINNFTFEKNGLMRKVSPNEYISESIRITINDNLKKYHIYLYNKPKKNCTNYLIKINDDIKEKLLTQLMCITEHNNILSLPNIKIDYNEMPAFKNNRDRNLIYVIISRKPKKFKEKSYELKNLYEIGGYLFGVHIFDVMKYQRIDRIVDFINKNEECGKAYIALDQCLKKFQSHFNWKQRERIMILSGVVFATIGLTCTADIDTLSLKELNDKSYAEKFAKEMEGLHDMIETHVLANDGHWYTTKGLYEYKSIWFTHSMPGFVGADDIFEVVSNPKYHYFFMGIKISSFDMNIKRFLTRSNANSLTDLIMLEKINKYQLGENLCVPNLTIRQGTISVFNNKTIEDLQHNIKKKIKLFYNVDMSLDEIKSIIKKCNLNAFDIYKGKNMYDPDTSIIKKFHLNVKEQFFYRFCKNTEYLLDIGSGQLTDMRMWNRVGVKNVVGIEPSIESIKNGIKRIEKYGTKTKITMINGVGDVDWKSDDKYKKIFDQKYDIITFNYTIHYMINKMDILMNNLLQTVKKGTLVIITCMDGNMIQNEIKKNGKVEVRNKQEPIFAIIPTDEYIQNNKTGSVLVYFKGAYGVASGSTEPLVDIYEMINTFKKNGFRLIEKRNFLNYNSKYKNEMSDIQKRVSGYYISLVLKYD